MDASQGVIAGILAIIVLALKIWLDSKQKKAEQDTPGKRAENDKQKVQDAIANGDTNIINDAFNDLRKAGHADSNNPK